MKDWNEIKTSEGKKKGQASKIIAYADKATERLQRKYRRMMYQGKARNVVDANSILEQEMN